MLFRVGEQYMDYTNDKYIKYTRTVHLTNINNECTMLKLLFVGITSIWYQLRISEFTSQFVRLA